MLVMFATCRDAIRTLPAMQHDAARPEDIDTEGEDHAADEIRYACMSRPMTRDLARVEPPLPPGVFRVSELSAAKRREERV
jgi:hypothetical protein